jgi:hypothetical protein
VGKPSVLIPNLLQRQFTATKPNAAWADRFDSFGEAKMELFDYGVLQPTAPSFDARPDQSGRLRTTRDSGVEMTEGRSVATSIPATCLTGTPPSNRRLSSTTEKSDTQETDSRADRFN